jgi:biopolymer transport protein ExbB
MARPLRDVMVASKRRDATIQRLKSMKLLAFLLAVLLGVAPLFGQAPDASGSRENPTTDSSRPGSRPPGGGLTGNNGSVIKSSVARPSDAPFNGQITSVNLWKLVQSGGWVMVPLGFLSVLTVMLVLVYLFTLRRSSILTPHYMNTADVLLKKRDYLGLLAISSRHSEAVARVVQRTLDFATKNPNASFEVVKDIAETEGASQAASLQHRTVYLADIGMLSPMIGLLGTVLGIIRSFGVLGSGQTTQSRDILLASGVSEALVATASGLILGILAMGFYSMFRNRVQSLISDLEIASAHVLALIALNYNKKREQSRVALEDEF